MADFEEARLVCPSLSCPAISVNPSLRRRQARWPVDEDYVGGARPDVSARSNIAHQFYRLRKYYDEYEAGTRSANKLLQACALVYGHAVGHWWD